MTSGRHGAAGSRGAGGDSGLDPARFSQSGADSLCGLARGRRGSRCPLAGDPQGPGSRDEMQNFPEVAQCGRRDVTSGRIEAQGRKHVGLGLATPSRAWGRARGAEPTVAATTGASGQGLGLPWLTPPWDRGPRRSAGHAVVKVSRSRGGQGTGPNLKDLRFRGAQSSRKARALEVEETSASHTSRTPSVELGSLGGTSVSRAPATRAAEPQPTVRGRPPPARPASPRALPGGVSTAVASWSRAASRSPAVLWAADFLL